MIRGEIYFIKQISIALILTLLLPSYQAYSQFNFQAFPTDNQILQRDDNDEVTIPIMATVNQSMNGTLTLKILQDDKPFSQTDLNLTGLTKISFSPKIKAGKFNYSIKLFLNNNEIKKAERVVGGDVFLIYGQSNALGYSGINEYWPARDVFLRYFVMNNYEQKNGQWLVPFETSQWPGIGLFPLELQRMLVEKNNYPVGVIVAAVGGSDITGLNKRNPANPEDINTNYGKLLSQMNVSGVRNQIKYMVFRQGESDAYFHVLSDVYPHEFTKLLNYLKTDLPTVKKIYNFQINILGQNNTRAGFLREFQRNSHSISSLIIPISTVGTHGHDGVHYSSKGYQETAFELSRILNKEIYKINESPEVYSPNIKKAYWEGNQLILEFDEGMNMVYPKDSTINNQLWQMKDFIYVDGKNDVVTGGMGVGNKIYLTTKSKGLNLTYLPSSYSNNNQPFYNGVYITNSLGMRAFSFENVSIKTNNPVVTAPEVGPLTIYIDTTIKCVGTQSLLHYTTYESLVDTEYKAQLSDATGSFAKPVVIGQGKTTPITITIPANLNEGGTYRIRLASATTTNEVYTEPFSIHVKSTATINTNTPQIEEGAEGLLTIVFNGSPPFNFILSDTSKHVSAKKEYQLKVKPLASTTYSIKELQNGCGVGITGGLAFINVLKKVIPAQPLANEPLADAFKLFPNPASDYLIIRSSDNAPTDFKLFDITGKLVHEVQFYNSIQLDVKKMPKSMYIYSIKRGESHSSGKLIIE